MTTYLETARLLIRPVKDSDEPVLQAWRGQEEYRKFVFSGNKQHYHLQFMVCRKKDAEPVGVVYTFSYNERDGYLFFNIFLQEKYRRLGYGAEACALAICHIFNTTPLYKMYCDAMSSNFPAVSLNRAGKFAEEGILRGHVLYAGERHDIIRFAVYRENLIYLNSLLERFKARKTR